MDCRYGSLASAIGTWKSSLIPSQKRAGCHSGAQIMLSIRRRNPGVQSVEKVAYSHFFEFSQVLPLASFPGGKTRNG